MSAIDDRRADEYQQTIGRWSEAGFSQSTPLTVHPHLPREVAELHQALAAVLVLERVAMGLVEVR